MANILQGDCSPGLSVKNDALIGLNDIGTNSTDCSLDPNMAVAFNEVNDEDMVAVHPMQITPSSGAQFMSSTLASDAIQIVALNSCTDGMLQFIDTKGWQLQVVPNPDNPEVATVIAVQPTVQNSGQTELHQNYLDNDLQPPNISLASDPLSSDSILMPPPPLFKLPAGVILPSWARPLKDCELIGDSFRGWVETDVELDLLLTYHKQQTSSFWGTRQSPSPAKPSTRLMWKSQYVPFDGIPFINAGSRAVVMECQYGPRRKGASHKKEGDIIIKGEFKQTCPARIYIKKVVKFPQYAVEIKQDKKSMKAAMDKAFNELKMKGTPVTLGVERYYVQFPTDKAHEFHGDGSNNISLRSAVLPPPSSSQTPVLRRLHPQVAEKIREMVATGETRIYAIRKQLRRFVEKEVCPSGMPERHDLTLFPTVNDLQNHIHQALKDIDEGSLPVTVKLQVPTGVLDKSVHPGDSEIWMGGGDEPHPESVTVTLTQTAGDDNHIISRVETHLSDGSTQVSNTLTVETASLLSKLHPGVFTSENGVITSPDMAIQDLDKDEDSIVGNNLSDDMLKIATTRDDPTLTIDNSHDHLTVSVDEHADGGTGSEVLNILNEEIKDEVIMLDTS